MWIRIPWVKLLLVSGRFWSGVLATAAFSRGTSYLERPPESNSFSSGAIEAYISYPIWGMILVVSVFFIALGHSALPLRNLAIFGHLLCLATYGTFGFSVAISALFYGQPWATAGSFMAIAFMHGARAVFLGEEIAQSRRPHER
jgi:drug/metabolite transporter (DMT)-like permease